MGCWGHTRIDERKFEPWWLDFMRSPLRIHGR
jgi:hypothetical protein